MSTISDVFDTAIREVTTARTFVSKVKTPQITRVDAKASLKATALAWFNTHRPSLTSNNFDLAAIDAAYTTVLESTSKYASRQTYLDALSQAKKALVALQSSALIPSAPTGTSSTDDIAPDFTPLAGNEEMRTILTRRWHECYKCVNADAHLAAIVMMGGLLEALFVARANKLHDKKPLVDASSAPKDKATGKTLNYQDWMLDSYIKVGHELQWITDAGKDVADILKEYRNYVHPEKERRHGVIFGLNDSQMLWAVTKSLVRHLLMSAGMP